MTNYIQQPTFFTIIARNYAAYALTLCHSIRRIYRESPIYIVIAEPIDSDIPAALSEFNVISSLDLDIPNNEQLAFQYDVMEYATAIKPYAFKWIFDNTLSDKVIYLDPDIYLLSPLKEVEQLLESSSNVILTPHILSPCTDEKKPNEHSFLQVGVYNLGFLALRRGEETFKLVNWWSIKLQDGAYSDPKNSLFTDQKWADLFPSLFEGVYILRDECYNVAYWNLAQRDVQHSADSSISINMRPVRFVHFSGVNPKHPHIFSKHQDRFTSSNIGDLSPIYRRYLQALLDNGYDKFIKQKYFYNHFSDGTKIDKYVRQYFRHVGNSKDIISAYKVGFSYFNALETTIGKNKLISKYLYSLHCSQQEVARAFQISDLPGQLDYALWVIEHGSRIYSLNQTAIDSLNIRLQAFTRTNKLSNSARSSSPRYMLRYFSHLCYKAYNSHPAFGQFVANMMPRKFISTIHKAAHTKTIHTTSNENEAYNQSNDYPSNSSSVVSKLLIVGYFSGEFGVAQSAHAIAKALHTIDYPFDIFTLSAPSLDSDFQHELNHLESRTSGCRDNILYCVNADQMNFAIQALSEHGISAKNRIGIWYWELAKFPNKWQSAFDFVDELWAPSRFIYDALANSTPSRVALKHIALPLDVQPSLSLTRRYFGLNDDFFYFIFSFDYQSYFDRKNPVAVINAFKLAFPSHDDNVRLIIKTSNSNLHLPRHSFMLAQCELDQRIQLIDRNFDRAELLDFYRSIDCYVSLHRSEGFGLSLAECMALGKPVIATAYSGNLDFMNQSNSCLVDFTLQAIAPNEYTDTTDQVWANPSIDHCVELMRRIYSDSNYRSRISKAARSFMAEAHAPKKAGEALSALVHQPQTA